MSLINDDNDRIERTFSIDTEFISKEMLQYKEEEGFENAVVGGYHHNDGDNFATIELWWYQNGSLQCKQCKIQACHCEKNFGNLINSNFIGKKASIIFNSNNWNIITCNLNNEETT